MAEVLNVLLRKERGTRASNRIRGAGGVPAVLYGHGEDNISLRLSADELNSAIGQGARMVDLAGDLKESALLSVVQWDAFGSDVLHVDLTRVSAEETVRLLVKVELLGEAVGSRGGGIVNHVLHEVEVECSAGNIPDSITVKIAQLEVGQAITIGELTIPEGVQVLADDDAVVVQCIEAMAEEEEEDEAAPGAAEPEVIGKKEEEEQTED